MTLYILAALALFVLQTFIPNSIRLLLSGNTPTDNLKYGLGGRDEPPPMPVYGARAERALANMHEALPVFLAVALLLELGGEPSSLAATGAVIFLVCRTLYVPSYIFAIFGMRSVFWTLGHVGIGVMVAALLR